MGVHMNLMKLFNLMDDAYGDQMSFVGLTYQTDKSYITVDVLEEDIFLVNVVPFSDEEEPHYFEAKGFQQFIFLLNKFVPQLA